MKNHASYLYVAGVATGIIMAILSVLTSFQMINYVNNGGSFLVLVLVSLLMGMVIGGIIAYLVNLLTD
jgi:hypothetical protein